MSTRLTTSLLVVLSASSAFLGNAVDAAPVTYDVSVQEGIMQSALLGGGITPDVNDLTGSFTYDGGVFSDIDVIINGQGASDVPVQTVTGGVTSLQFAATFAPSDSTLYAFDIDQPLGSNAGTINASNVVFSPFDSAQFGDDTCGSDLFGQSGPSASTWECSGTLTRVQTAAAPELDPSFACTALTLLLGGLVVLRGRRNPGSRSTAR